MIDGDPWLLRVGLRGRGESDRDASRPTRGSLADLILSLHILSHQQHCGCRSGTPAPLPDGGRRCFCCRGSSRCGAASRPPRCQTEEDADSAAAERAAARPSKTLLLLPRREPLLPASPAARPRKTPLLRSRSRRRLWHEPCSLSQRVQKRAQLFQGPQARLQTTDRLLQAAHRHCRLVAEHQLRR